MTQNDWDKMLGCLMEYRAWIESDAPHLFSLLAALNELLDQLPPSVAEAYEDVEQP